MFVGFAANAQYLPATKARNVVTSTVQNLKKDVPVAAQTGQATPAAIAANRVHSLKIQIGDLMMKPLEQGRSVEDALTLALSQFNPGNNAERKQALTEVESFYKNLLKKSF
ncbi:MAG: hypothetical protein IPN86_09530 [Saprospiraceae bacterium]|nr:hypothetical protein [Saprospiraceae bacterium]